MELEELLKGHDKVAIAFSGGVDSAYLLYKASLICDDVMGYYVKTAFQPSFEFNDAINFVKKYKLKIKIIEIDILLQDDVIKNSSKRCYYCKKNMFEVICRQALIDGYDIIMDGTNASDDESERPGMLALNELNVYSPLRECGLSKMEIRKLSKEAGIFTWDKPAYSCLATRINQNEKITEEKLHITEVAEDFLFSLGFNNFRVRMIGDKAKIQISEDQFEKMLQCRKDIVEELKKYYSDVLLDLEARI